MNTITTQNAAEINRHHQLACAKADEAVGHAVEAGKLLLQVKSALRHGQFLTWLEANVTVTARQAQRYIAAAQGRPTAIRALGSKSDTVSHLVKEVDSGVGPKPTAPEWQPKPQFTPPDAQWGICASEAGSFVVEPSSEHAGFFFVSRMYPEAGESLYDCTARPVRADWVEETLQFYGLQSPGAAEWRFRPSAGVRVALETLNSDEAVRVQITGKETVAEAIARMRRTNDRLHGFAGVR
jgi:hypothetical protein